MTTPRPRTRAPQSTSAGAHPAQQRDPSRFHSRLGARARFGTIFHVICLFAT
jgi:hypothetical protein